MDWINVREKLPETNPKIKESRKLLTWGPDYDVEVGIYCTDGYGLSWWSFEYDQFQERYYTGKHITHWMPLPAPPELEV